MLTVELGSRAGRQLISTTATALEVDHCQDSPHWIPPLPGLSMGLFNNHCLNTTGVLGGSWQVKVQSSAGSGGRVHGLLGQGDAAPSTRELSSSHPFVVLPGGRHVTLNCPKKCCSACKSDYKMSKLSWRWLRLPLGVGVLLALAG